MKKPTYPRTYPALAIRIIGPVLALWLVLMGTLTWAVASDMRIQLEEQVQDFADSAGTREDGDDTGLPGTEACNMISRLGYPYYFLNLEKLFPFVISQHLTNGVGTRDWLWGKWELYYGYEAALIYYDETGEELIRTGDYLSFTYTTEENWSASNTDPVGYGYVALDDIPGGAEAFGHLLIESPYGSSGTNMFLPLLRLTGYFEGSEFHPTRIQSGRYLNYQGRVTDVAQLVDLDSRGHVEWTDLLTAPEAENREPETIYAFEIDGYNASPKPVSAGGQHFDSLSELLHADMVSGDLFSLEKESLMESVLIARRSHEDVYGDYTISIAVRFRPLLYAAVRLLPVYLISGLLAATCLWIMLRRIRLELTGPLENLARSIWDGSTINPLSEWSEPSVIEEHFVQTREALAQNQTDLQQLRTALDYARDAEENRKQLISNITHELKTPLAIIHSYAECLNEGIAAEKREQYLGVILEEAERMDAMVVQMLDLSRLEAGRVRLSADSFSLLELTRRIVEKFTPLLKKTELSMEFGPAQDFRITADEGRIGQAITNLLSNALKYTPQGGTIQIKVYLDRSGAYLFVENTAPHLSDEALEKVFDSFYRTDPSRNTPGTGLGLTLVKTIVTLHGGTCFVRNTLSGVEGSFRTGVEFGFCLPLNV